MKYGIIYQLINKVTGKSYIGQTTKPLSQRLSSHFLAKTYIGNSLRLHGKEGFKIKILENAPIKDLNILEEFYINAANSLYPNGYNLALPNKKRVKVHKKTIEKLKFTCGNLIYCHNNNKLYRSIFAAAARLKLNYWRMRKAVVKDMPWKGFVFSLIKRKKV